MRNDPGINTQLLKIIYRGNFTFAQAALYLGIGVDKIKLLVDKGLLGTGQILQSGPTIPRIECDRFLLDNITYRVNSKVEETAEKLFLITGAK